MDNNQQTDGTSSHDSNAAIEIFKDMAIMSRKIAVGMGACDEYGFVPPHWNESRIHQVRGRAHRRNHHTNTTDTEPERVITVIKYI